MEERNIGEIIGANIIIQPDFSEWIEAGNKKAEEMQQKIESEKN